MSLENQNGIFSTPAWKTWRDNFIQDAPKSLARSTWKQLSPEPSQVNLDEVSLKHFYSLTAPKSFISCRQDQAMSSRYFHPGKSSRLGTCKLLELDGRHEVTEKDVEASSE